MVSVILIVVAYCVAINLVTAALFWLDKRRATHGGYRVPERQLLTLAAMGGSPAAQFAGHNLRHKTQKQPFVSHMRRIVQMQRITLLALAIVTAILLW